VYKRLIQHFKDILAEALVKGTAKKSLDTAGTFCTYLCHCGGGRYKKYKLFSDYCCALQVKAFIYFL
jgi:hypothetical protein